ncbi:inositol monophosphatase family protein [Pacificibacter marinus]|uniref:Inositol-1-monophosphatase n=1 Tax=Pacificibacter marinus TaxID=658057 RepID=A0A1Y5SEF0_9RHOB|nr:inositol monophosphatase [Pacificibacter marinus]SEK53085.1 myo-inositol-1(or 4)-monophosphatase [Pacificibacter marinus]SLN38709.1 Inositol-1-monophosphatase [Pacificibacter marinus]
MSLSDRLLFAARTAREAGKLAQTMRKNPNALNIAEKGHQDFVTAADTAVEDLIRLRIREAFGDDAVLGEEGGLQGTNTHLWIIDPIDGTTNFMRGLPDWAVSIAYCHDGEIVLGVIFAPDLDLMAQGHSGVGGSAQLNGVPMAVSKARAANTALVTVGWSPRTEFSAHAALLGDLIAKGAEYRRPGAATIGLLSVAAGWTDAYVEKHLNVWDAAAGIALIRSAGGTVKMPPLEHYLQHGASLCALCSEEHELSALLQNYHAS